MKKITFGLLAMIVSLLLPQRLLAGIIEFDFTKIANVTFTYGTSRAARLNGVEVFLPTNCDALNGRIAFQNVGGRVWCIEDAGLTLNADGDSHFALLNLKAGDKVTLTVATGQVLIRSGNAYSATSDWGVLVSGTEYEMATDGAFMLQGKKEKTVISSIKIETKEEEAISKPAISVTGVNGKQRTISITSGKGTLGSDATATYYTLDGTDPTMSEAKIEYKEPFVIEETKTIKAVSYLSSVASEIEEKEVEAGVTVKLPNPKVFVSSFIQDGLIYNPVFNASIDNSSVIASPSVNLAVKLIKKDGTEVSEISLPHTASESGTLFVTASADGYESSETEMPVIANYTLNKSTSDLSVVNSSNIADELGSTWTIATSPTRWSNWSKTGGVNSDGTANDGEEYYTASSSDGETIIYDFLKVANGANLLIGYGLGRNDKGTSCWIENPVEGAIAGYTLTIRGENENNVYVTGTESATLSVSLNRYGENILKKAYYYIPVEKVSVNIGEAGYSTFSSTSAIDFSAAEDLTIYTAKLNDTKDVVSLTEVADKKVPANTGVILKGTGEFTGVVTTGVADFESNDLIANTEATTVTRADNVYVLNNVEGIGFYPFVGTLTVGRAHLVIDGGNARTIKITFGGDTTGITDVENTAAGESKVWHTLSGVRVQKPTKGLYIVNGKKVVVK